MSKTLKLILLNFFAACAVLASYRLFVPVGQLSSWGDIVLQGALVGGASFASTRWFGLVQGKQDAR